MDQGIDKQNNTDRLNNSINKGAESLIGQQPNISSPESLSNAFEHLTQVDPSVKENDPGPIAVVLPDPVLADDSLSQSIQSDDNSNPAIAEDDDLIEKEWVDKAKRIVADNKKDPYIQEEKVADLKVDYIKKRFGRELGKTK